MKMKKRLVIVLCFILLVSSSLVACGGSTEKLVSKNENSNNKKVTLKFWRAGTDISENEYWKRVMSEFEAQHEGITIEYSEVPFGNEMETKLNAAFASGTSPDVISYSLASVAQRAHLGQYEPLDQYLEKWEEKDDLIDNVYETGVYKDNLYGIGFIPDPRVLVWRKDMFTDAGLDPESPPQDWETLRDYSLKLTKRDGNTTTVAGFSIPTTNGWTLFQSFVLQNGGKIIDAETNTPLFNSPEAIEATEFLVDLVKEGTSIPSDANKSSDNLFVNGKAAMAYDSPSAVANLQKTNPDLADKIGIAGPIARKQKATFAGMRLLFMSSQSKEKDLAFEFMTFIMAKEETWKRYKEIGAPIVYNSLKEDYIKDNPEMNSAIFEAVTYGQGAAKVTYAGKISEILNTYIEQAYYGKKSAEQALNDAAEHLLNEMPNLITD